MPKVDRSLYFHRKEYLTATDNGIKTENSVPNDERVTDLEDAKSQQSHLSEKLVKVSPFKLLWSHFKNAYTNVKVVQWSIWYAVGFCGYMQVSSYVQVLWKDIEPEPSVSY